MSNSYQDIITSYDPMNCYKEMRDKFKQTNIYKYYKNNKNNKLIRKIIKKNKSSVYTSISYALSNIYSDLTSDMNMLNVLIELIKINDVSENKYIFRSAIFSSNFKILDELISNGFNINTINLHCFDAKCEPLLVEAIDGTNIDVIKYLINNGADPYLCDNISIICGLANENMDIFNFFKQYEIPIKDLEEAFIQYLSIIKIHKSYARSRKNTHINLDYQDYNNVESDIYGRINYFLDQGCDINKIYQIDIDIFARLDLNILIYLENRQLYIDNQLINKTILINNISTTEYLLKQGFIPDNNTKLNVVSKLKMEFLKLFIKYQIDISEIEPIKNENHQLVSDLIKSGISCEKLLDCIITSFNYYD
ncbi:ankyrin repeat protein [Acanthamoeba polyphaga moumouvirus]|uniref:Ankyrin repeat protein n=1 Tax=Acanthamoeba polyphaga moumouvirus TaxID=1269028 RepID=L7RFS1_9VIRU|nr:ankyrin repeat protein [Acanthamoeba polyphaga moumouvirus]AGC01700.1 ankyrin repeat protein [Acanthamoeba polyphaga moumouvirus]AQN68038.1 ankyrin repeat protein [Saudi moumouvirus]